MLRVINIDLEPRQNSAVVDLLNRLFGQVIQTYVTSTRTFVYRIYLFHQQTSHYLAV